MVAGVEEGQAGRRRESERKRRKGKWGGAAAPGRVQVAGFSGDGSVKAKAEVGF